MSANLKQAPRPGLGTDTLLFGVGNCGRRDDGLGWAFLDRIQHEPACLASIEYRYQLQVEDAAQVARAQRVIFIDSFRGEIPGGYLWSPCTASESFEFTTHVLPPRGVMHYCRDLYGKSPPADTLMIQGVAWNLEQGMSPEACRNLESALDFFRREVLGAS